MRSFHEAFGEMAKGLTRGPCRRCCRSVEDIHSSKTVWQQEENLMLVYGRKRPDLFTWHHTTGKTDRVI